jgi:trimeric autotransporter adhesin
MKSIIKLTACIILVICTGKASAQTNTFPTTGSAGVGTTSPNSSALLEMSSNTKGMLIPRMSKNQRIAIASPSTGLLVYQTNLNPGFYFYTGTIWKAIKGGITPSLLAGNGITISNDSIINSVPDKLVTLAGTGATTVTGTYPDFIISSTSGEPGPIGPVGPTGPAGNDGIDGTNGIDGAPGATGPVGPAGPQGPIGLTGATGAPGAAGADGINGTNGVDGVMGATGPAGAQGPIGLTGATGAAGADGATGAQGPIGLTGTMGPAGPTYTAGSGIDVTGTTITNTSPDQAVTLTGSGATTVTGTYPNFNISSTSGGGNYTAGTGISIAGTTISNTGDTDALDDITNNTFFAGDINGTYATMQVDGFMGRGLAGAAPADGQVYRYNSSSGIWFPSQAVTAGAGISVSSSGVVTNTGDVNGNDDANNVLSNLGGSAVNVNLSPLTNDTYDLGVSNWSWQDLYLRGSIYMDGNRFISNTAGNIVMGTLAGTNITTGYNNAIFGWSAGERNTTGVNNTFIGTYAADSNETGNGNISIGLHSGQGMIAGTENTFVGPYAGTSANGISGSVALGNEATVTANIQARIGGPIMNSIGGFNNWTNLSDGRMKSNIRNDVPGLDFINILNPVTYNLNVEAIQKMLGKDMSRLDPEAVAKKESMKLTGFIAQEVEKAASSIGYNFSGVDKPQNERDFYGLRYAEFTVPLVKAVQELSKLNYAKDEKLDALTSQVEELKTQFASLQSAIANSKSAITTDGMVRVSTSEETSIALLGQNLPNPFDNSTIIPFRIPKECHSATIIITEATGKINRAIPVSCRETQLALEAGVLVPGIYSYSLLVDGVTVDTKQMVLVK